MCSQEPVDHPAKHDRPDRVVNLSVYNAEWADLKAICAKYGPIQIVAVEKVPIIPVQEVYVLCHDAQTARALDDAWWTYAEMSPHRPHGEEECLAWGAQFNPFPNVPHDWTF